MSTSQKLSGLRSAKSMKFILVYGTLRTGGIETLIVRMANFLVSHGVPVSIYCAEGGELTSLLDDRVSFIESFRVADFVKTTCAFATRTDASTNVIVSFDPISAARALMFEASLPEKMHAIHVSGIYHPRAYFMTGERADRIILNFLVACAVGMRQLFFMNEECRRSHALRWKVDLSNSRLLALPINQLESRWKSSCEAAIHVVSVGRLVNFKKYNMGAAKIVRTCLDRGIAIKWDIFGDGPMRDSIRMEIDAHKVTEHVRLMGALDYCDYSECIAGYDLFVGMGTAALEAAMIGIPTVCATVDEATRCYGYLQDLPFGNVGELQDSSPTVELSDLIVHYSRAGRYQRENLSRQGRMAAEMYGMPKFFDEIIHWVSSEVRSPSRIIKRLVAGLYYFATESFLIKGARFCASRLRST